MTEPTRANFTAGLREVAEFLDAHPEVPLPHMGAYAAGSSLPAMSIYLLWGADEMATVARAMADGGTAQKRVKEHHDGYASMQVWREFAGVVLVANIDRTAVCERVVVGSETVTKTVPDPEALAAVPEVEVTEEVEIVEWQCKPLLASEDTPAVTA